MSNTGKSFLTKRNKIIIAIAVAAVLLTAVLLGVFLNRTAEPGVYENAEYSFRVENGEVTLLKYKGSEVDIVLPTKLKNAVVSAVGKECFKDYTKLQTLTLPVQIKSVGESAFEGCTSLKTVDFKNKDAVIGTAAFKSCHALESVALPANLQVLPESIFENGFSSSTKPGIQEIIIPETVKIIGAKAFADCRRLSSVNIPEGVQEIGEMAFYYCNYLEDIQVLENGFYKSGGKTIAFPSTLTKIGERAFNGVTRITKFEIPNSVSQIGGGAFTNLSSTTNLISLQADNPYFEVVSVQGNSSTTGSTLRNLLYTKGKQTLISVANINTSSTSVITESIIEIADGVQGIANYAFHSSTQVSAFTKPLRIIIPSSMLYIGDYAFETVYSSALNVTEIHTKDCYFGKLPFARGGTILYIPGGSVEDFKQETNGRDYQWEELNA